MCHLVPGWKLCPGLSAESDNLMAEHLMNVLRGAGSILDIWPAPVKLDETYTRDVDELFRQSWEETGRALRRAMDEVDVAPEEAEEEAASSSSERPRPNS